MSACWRRPKSRLIAHGANPVDDCSDDTRASIYHRARQASWARISIGLRHRGLAPTLTLESHASRPRPLYESAGLRVRRLPERDKRCSPGAKRSHRLRDETSSRRPAVVEHHVGRNRLAVVRVLTSARLNTAIGSPTPRRGKLPHRCRRSRQLALVAKAAEKSALRSSSLLSVSSRAAMLT